MSIKLLIPAVGLFTIASCSGPEENRLSGTVTVDGRMLEKGFITFFPVNGPETSRGVEVVEGKYELTGLNGGMRRAVISETPNAEIVVHKTGVEMLRFSKSITPVTPKTIGNNAVVEIQPGRQTLNFSLTNPSTSSRKP